jgi:hypothetical protein
VKAQDVVKNWRAVAAEKIQHAHSSEMLQKTNVQIFSLSARRISPGL